MLLVVKLLTEGLLINDLILMLEARTVAVVISYGAFQI